MKVQILGAHQFESKGTRLTSLVIDGTLVIDAGGLTSALSVQRQKKIKAVLLTHHHFDHTRDLVTLAANAGYYWQGQVEVYGLRYTLDRVTECLLDGKMYINFLEYPSKERPCLLLRSIEPYEQKDIAGYKVLAVPSTHPVPCLGYQVSSPQGKSLFYTGDATVGISQYWEYVSPQLLITEITGLNKYGDWLKKTGHLCAALLKEELIQFRQLKGYLPRVIVIHLGNAFEKEIEREVAEVAQQLEADIGLGYENMSLTL